MTMKKDLLLLLSLLLGTMALATPSKADCERAAKKGDSLYAAANYEDAAATYENILASGYVSADLYYNLAGAYYRQDRIPQAILNYERALQLKPGIKDASDNLSLAYSKTQDRITPLPKLFIVRWHHSLVTKVTTATWNVICQLLLFLLLASLLVMLLSRSVSLRKGALATLFATGALFIVASLLLFQSYNHRSAHRDAIVMQSSVIVKASPEERSTDKFLLHAGTKVEVDESLSGWNKVILADGNTGWLPSQSIERI